MNHTKNKHLHGFIPSQLRGCPDCGKAIVHVLVKRCTACNNLRDTVQDSPKQAIKYALEALASETLIDFRTALGRFWWVTLLACALVLGVAIGLVILMCRTGVLTP